MLAGADAVVVAAVQDVAVSKPSVEEAEAMGEEILGAVSLTSVAAEDAAVLLSQPATPSLFSPPVTPSRLAAAEAVAAAKDISAAAVEGGALPAETPHQAAAEVEEAKVVATGAAAGPSQRTSQTALPTRTASTGSASATSRRSTAATRATCP
jgi:hypothetical protein